MLEFFFLTVSLIVALSMRPWRMLASRKPLVTQSLGDTSPLWTPMLATLVILPWLWALPSLHKMPLQLPWSGACLVVLCLGWPLAIPVLCAVGVMTYAFSGSLEIAQTLHITVWQGIAPATFALCGAAMLRRWLGTRVFVYIFGRGFVCSVVSLFVAGILSSALGSSLPDVEPDLSNIARWLMAWGDAIITGMMCAIFVAYKPEWLATWSDELYLYSQKRRT